MPRVIKRTPEWLVPPSPGHALFDFKPSTSTSQNLREPSYNGPLRTIAKGRGAEVFIAHGNELRWADLGGMKGQFQEREGSSMRNSFRASQKSEASATGEEVYRVLRVPGAGAITQLVVSREKEYLAIVRSHQIYVAVLPDLVHLTESGVGPYKLKCFHLGPTIHCVEEAGVVSAIWHPLGEYGRCLVTVTDDAVVRLWEINRDDRSTFEQPSLALDLKKLANVTSANQDFSASKFGSAKGFTPDVELEPAAVCFGGKGVEGENPWHAATLWIATKAGDVYALCPLLPRRFETAADFLDSLSAVVAAKQLEAEAERIKLYAADMQAQFLADLQDQEPILAQGETEFESRYIWSRPTQPGPAPKLQGPFELDEEPDEEQSFADIYVVPMELPEDALLSEDLDLPGSASLVCLLTQLGQVLMTIEFDGVDAQWVPTRSTPTSTPKRPLAVPDSFPSLVLSEIVVLPWSDASAMGSHPTITPDIASPHAFFVTTATGVHYISASSWITQITEELANPDAAAEESGTSTRLEVITDSARSLVECPIPFSTSSSNKLAAPPVACVIWADNNSSRIGGLGYFLLTLHGKEPWAAQLDISDNELTAIADSPLGGGLGEEFDYFSSFSADKQRQLMSAQPRESYRADPVFERPSQFPNFIRHLSADRKTSALLREDVDLNDPSVLEMMVNASMAIETEYKELSAGAITLFAQSKRLQESLKDQIRRVRELKEGIDAIIGENDEDQETVNEGLERRMQRSRDKQEALNARLDGLKSKLSRVSAKEMSDKEKAFAKEIEDLDRKLVTGEVDEVNGAKASAYMERLMRVTTSSAELKAQAEEIGDAGEQKKGDESPSKRMQGMRVPEGFRKQKVSGIMDLLEREQVLVDRAVEKFGRLKVGS